MNFFKRVVEKINNQFKRSIKEFKVPLLYIFLTTIYACVLIENTSLNIYVLLSLFCGVLISTILSLLINKRRDLLCLLITTALCALLFILLNYLILSEYLILTYCGTVVLLVSMLAYILIKNNKPGYFNYLLINSIYISILCSILFSGIIEVVLAFHYLIVDIGDIGNAILIIVIIVYLLVYGSLFLSCFELNKEEINTPKQLVNIYNIASLSVYYLLLLVLYVYIFKIIFTLSMPVGQLNIFASFALLFNAFFYFTVEEERNVLTKFHHRYGGFVLIPVFIIQLLAIIIRLNAYGLTTARYLSLAFNVVGLCFIIAPIIKKKNWIFIAIAILSILVCYTPLNAIDVPVYNQQAILEKTLNKYDMIKDGTIVPNNNVELNDQETLLSAFNYLSSSSSNKKKYDFNYRNFEETFGFNMPNINEQYCSYQLENVHIDVNGYSFVDVVEDYSPDCTIEGIDVKEMLCDIYNDIGPNGVISYDDNVNSELACSPRIKLDDKREMIFEYIMTYIENGDPQYIDYRAYILTK